MSSDSAGCPTGSSSVPTSPTSPTPTPTRSRPCTASTWAMTGCGRCCGTTVPASSDWRSTMPDVPDSGAFAAALRSLYAVPPEDFMAERKRLVAAEKADGDPAVAKEIGTLRKPSLAAWAVNLLAREAPDLVDGLADLGGRMGGEIG